MSYSARAEGLVNMILRKKITQYNLSDSLILLGCLWLRYKFIWGEWYQLKIGLSYQIADQRVKIYEKRKDRQIPRSCQRAENSAEHECDGATNCSWNPWNGPKGFGKETGWIGDQRNNWDHSGSITVRIGKNT